MKELIYIKKDKNNKNRFYLHIDCYSFHLALINSLARLCQDTCNSCLNFQQFLHTKEHNENILTFTTLRIAERTAESISYLTGIPCKWHESFGRITKPVIEPSKCSM